jgi:hypothetical protein
MHGSRSKIPSKYFGPYDISRLRVKGHSNITCYCLSTLCFQGTFFLQVFRWNFVQFCLFLACYVTSRISPNQIFTKPKNVMAESICLIYMYTGCTRINLLYFELTFLSLKMQRYYQAYGHQTWMVSEKMAGEFLKDESCYTVFWLSNVTVRRRNV